jgi:acyl carrier protein
MADGGTRELIVEILKRDYKFDITDSDMLQLGPRDVGLDSLSEAELYLELSDALDLKDVVSPESGSNFAEIIQHFDNAAKV